MQVIDVALREVFVCGSELTGTQWASEHFCADVVTWDAFVEMIFYGIGFVVGSVCPEKAVM